MTVIYITLMFLQSD